MAGGKVAVMIMLVAVVVVMVGGGDASSSSSPPIPNDIADYISCVFKCDNKACSLPFNIPNPICKAACMVECAIPSTSTAHRFCNVGCISSNCNTLFSNSNSGGGADHYQAAIKGCVRGCADICNPSSTTPLTGLGQGQGQDRNQLV